MSVHKDNLSFHDLTFDHDFHKTGKTEKEPRFTQIHQETPKYERMKESVSEISVRLIGISGKSKKEGDKQAQAGIKALNIQERQGKVDNLLKDVGALNEVWNTLPERVRRRLEAKHGGDEAKIQDELKSAFLFAFLKKDLRSTRGSKWNWMFGTQGNTTSFKALRETAKEQKIDSDLQECLRRRIRNPGTYWQPCKKEDRQQDLQNRTVIIHPKLVYGEETGPFGHSGAKIEVELGNGRKQYFKVEGFSHGCEYESGRDPDDRKLQLQMVGRTHTVEFSPIKITPSQYKLLQLSLEDCGNQRYSGLAYNCAHTARRALQFCGIDLESSLFPVDLTREAIFHQLKDIEKQNTKIWEGLANKEEPKKEEPNQTMTFETLSEEGNLTREEEGQLDLDPNEEREKPKYGTQEESRPLPESEQAWRPHDELDEKGRIELWGGESFEELERQEKVAGVVKERLRNEIQRLELELTVQRMSPNKIQYMEERLQKSQNSMKSVLEKFSKYRREGEEVKSAFQKAVKEVRSEVGKDDWKTFYEGPIRACLEGDIWRHLDQLYPKPNN